MTKKCTKCGDCKELEAYNKDKRRSDGRRSDCKLCQCARMVIYYKENLADNLAYKEYRARYYEKNRERITSRERARYYKNRDHLLAQKRTYQQEPSVKARRALYQQQYTEANRERLAEYLHKWKQNNPDWQRNYYKANRNRLIQHAINYDRRRQNADGDFTLSQWVELCEMYGGACLRCRQQKPLTRDHVVPLSKGGTNHLHNIQPLCKSCNCSKGTRATDYRPRATMKAQNG